MKLTVARNLRHNLAELRDLESWMEEFARAAELSAAARRAFDLAVTEWVTNVIHYAFQDEQDHQIQVQFKVSPGQAQVEIEDDGRAFNPLEHPAVDISQPLEKRPVGGLGIHMIRQVMDRVDYQRDDGLNRLILTRRNP